MTAKRLVIPPADYDDPRSAWTFFGLAVYAANLVEQSLVNLAAVLHIPAVKVVSQQELDSIFQELDRKTMGQLLSAARLVIAVPADLEAKLTKVLERRNYLVHSFFRIHAEDALSDAGNRAMIGELRDVIALFIGVDPELEYLYKPLWDKYGINEAFVQAEWVAAQARAAAETPGRSPRPRTESSQSPEYTERAEPPRVHRRMDGLSLATGVGLAGLQSRSSPN